MCCVLLLPLQMAAKIQKPNQERPDPFEEVVAQVRGATALWGLWQSLNIYSCRFRILSKFKQLAMSLQHSQLR